MTYEQLQIAYRHAEQKINEENESRLYFIRPKLSPTVREIDESGETFMWVYANGGKGLIGKYKVCGDIVECWQNVGAKGTYAFAYLGHRDTIKDALALIQYQCMIKDIQTILHMFGETQDVGKVAQKIIEGVA